jgi:hypothetical protein
LYAPKKQFFFYRKNIRSFLFLGFQHSRIKQMKFLYCLLCPVMLIAALAIPTPSPTNVFESQNSSAPTNFSEQTNSSAKTVNLRTASDFAILSKAGISTVPHSHVTGNIGVSPIAATAITGFSLVAHQSNTYSTSPQITGRAYAADFTLPTPSALTSSIGDMETAYKDAASRTVSQPSNVNIMTGLISGATLTAGVYVWDTDINFSSDIYLKGSNNSIFIFQTSGNIVVGSGAKIILLPDPSGTAPSASNIFWQLAGFVEAGAHSHLEGVFLAKTHVVLKTGSSLNGQILSQTAVTLDMATVVLS